MISSPSHRGPHQPIYKEGKLANGFATVAHSRFYVRVALAALLLVVLLTSTLGSSSDYEWRGLNPSEVNVSPANSTVTSNQLILRTGAGLPYAIATIAALSVDFSVSLDVTFAQSSGRDQVGIAVASPYNETAATVDIDSPTPGHAYVYWRLTNSAGQLTNNSLVMPYSLSTPLGIVMHYAAGGSVTFSLAQGNQSRQLVYPSGPLSQVEPPNLDVWLDASSPGASAAVWISNVTMTAPNPTSSTGIIQTLLIVEYSGVLLLGYLAFVPWGGRYLVSLPGRLWQRTLGLLRSTPVVRYVAIVAVVALPLQLWIMTLGTNNFDMYTQELWSYLMVRSGPVSIYPISSIVPGGIANGAGWPSAAASAFPNPPLALYIYGGVGGLMQVLAPGQTLPSSDYELAIKAVWLALLDLTGLVVALAINRWGSKPRLAVFAFAAIAFNPALWLGALVWGQSDVLLALFITLAAIAYIRQQWAWSIFLIILAVLSKQTALIAFLVFIPVITLTVGLRRGADAILRAVTGGFVVLLPILLAGYSFSYVVGISIGPTSVAGLGSHPVGSAFWTLTVSNGAFNTWPMVTTLVNGQHGLARLSYPDTVSTGLFGVTYVELGVLCVGLGIVCVWAEAIRAKIRGSLERETVPLTILLGLLFFEALTRYSERYLLFVIPLTLLLLSNRSVIRLTTLLWGAITATVTLAFLSNLSSSAEQGTGALAGFAWWAPRTSSDFYIDVVVSIGFLAVAVCICLVYLLSRSVKPTVTDEPTVGDRPDNSRSNSEGRPE